MPITHDEQRKKWNEEHRTPFALTQMDIRTTSEQELDEMYDGFELIKSERVEKTTEFFGKSYRCKHHWRVYKK